MKIFKNTILILLAVFITPADLIAQEVSKSDKEEAPKAEVKEEAKKSNKNESPFNQFSAGLRALHLYDVPFYRFDTELNRDMKGLNGENTSFDLGLDFYYEYQINPLIGFQAGFRVGSLTGANEVEYYKNSFQELNLDMVLILSNLSARLDRLPVNVYAKVGLGSGWYEASRYLHSDHSLNSQRERNFFDGRVGAGLQYKISNNLRLELEAAYNAVYDDGFDGYKTGSGSNPFISTGIGVAYTFGDKDKDPMHSISMLAPPYSNGVFDIAAAKKDEAADDSKKDQQVVINDANNDMTAVASSLKTLSEELAAMKAQLEEQQALVAAQQAKIDEQAKRIEELTAENGEYLASKEESAEEMPEVESKEEEVKPEGVTYWNAARSEVEVFFGFDSDELTPETQLVLQEALGNSAQQISLIGYASPEGNPGYNDRLKRRRVDMVKDYLIFVLGIDSDNIVETSAGDVVDLGDNNHLNRKVMVKFEKLSEVAAGN